MERFVIARWAKRDDRIKLRPMKNDRSALEKLVAGDPDEYEPASNMTINYRFFCDQILKEEIQVNAMFEAIEKLQIISITLDGDDKTQPIFESLNSTGLTLTYELPPISYVQEMGGSSILRRNYFLAKLYLHEC